MNLTFSIIFLRPNFNEPDCFLQDSGSLDGRTKLWLFRWMQFWPSSVIWLEERKRTIDPPLKRKIPNAIEQPRHFPTLESLSIKKYFGIYLKSFVGKNVVFLSLVRRQCAILQFSFCKHLTSSWRSYRWKRQFFSLWWKGKNKTRTSVDTPCVSGFLSNINFVPRTHPTHSLFHSYLGTHTWLENC